MTTNPYDWHPWFAWFPVQMSSLHPEDMDGRLRPMKCGWVERKFVADPPWTDYAEYRPINRYDWHSWFAWYPVRLSAEVNEGNGFSYADSGNCAWLRWIERRTVTEELRHGWMHYTWEYRVP